MVNVIKKTVYHIKLTKSELNRIGNGESFEIEVDGNVCFINQTGLSIASQIG